MANKLKIKKTGILLNAINSRHGCDKLEMLIAIIFDVDGTKINVNLEKRGELGFLVKHRFGVGLKLFKQKLMKLKNLLKANRGNILITTSTPKKAPPVPLSWCTGGCRIYLFIVVFYCLINSAEALEDTTIAIISFTSPFIACLAFWVSICLLKKLRTNDTDSKKETKMEEGKQLQNILIKQEETTEEEDPSTIEIDVTQASELDNGVDKQEISEKEAVLVQNVQKNVLLKRSKSVTNLSIADRSLKRSCSCRQINMEMNSAAFLDVAKLYFSGAAETSTPKQYPIGSFFTLVYVSEELGSICEIKASVTPLNVDFKVLGKAGKSVEHTRQIALQFIEAYAEKLDVIFPDPKEKTITTHYKPSDLEKDGYSSGAACTAAIVSLLKNKPVETDIAIIGGIETDGKLEKVGGLRVKLRHAKLIGYTKIIIPESMREDYNKLYAEERAGITAIFIENFLDALKYLFVEKKENNN
uniref:Lon proteolytic domain-containing protein n=1 Tax=Meloidogyne floridensis TaxID=298350 RepID=A0A915NP68_9BILA